MADEPVTRLKSVQLISAAILISSILYSLVGIGLITLRVIPAGGLADAPDETKSVIESTLCAIGLLTGAASIFLRKQLDAGAPPGAAGLPVRLRNVLLAMALAETPGVFGFVAAVLLGDLMIPVILWGTAIAGCILHFPTEATLGPRE